MNVSVKKIIFGFLFISILLIPAVLSATDFGIVLNQNAMLGSFKEDDSVFEYRADLIPRFSTMIDKNGSFIVTAGLTFGFKDDTFTFVPEILHTEYLNLFEISGMPIWLRAGRIPYSDPLGFIAEGLFDGVHVSHTAPMGYFGFGLWYTGLLYKKNINVEMSNTDRGNNDIPFEFSDFTDTYFAPGRILAAFDYEHPSLLEILRLKSSLMVQFDLTGGEETINSQYLSVKAGYPWERFLFEAGGILQLSQIKLKTDNTVNLAFAGDLGISWHLPVENNSLLSLNMLITSGQTSELMGAFIPITSKNQGRIFQPILSALTVFKLNYSSRLSESMGASITASYFIRNDKFSFNNFNINTEGGGFFLGPELYARFVWNLFSDLQLNLGAGVFAPSLGDAAPNDKLQWRADLTVVFSIY